MRRRVIVFVSTLSLSVSGSVASAPVWAKTGSPASISVDCDQADGVAATTVTGEVGDTVTIDNTAGSEGCTFAGIAGVVTATNLTTNVLASGATSTLTIVKAGTFTITPKASSGGGAASTMTVVIGRPQAVTQYTITFDANGGNCSSNPLVVTAASGDWYGLPTGGTGSFQCHRDDYTLIGWSRGSTIDLPGEAAQVPDVPVVDPDTAISGKRTKINKAMAADHVTLYAVWSPKGVQITYDANVAATDQCIDSVGLNLPASERTTDPTVYFPERGGTLAAQAPCAPVDGTGNRLHLRGWAFTGNGQVVQRPGARLQIDAEAGSTTRLYAAWDREGDCSAPARPGVNWARCDKPGADLSGTWLSNANLVETFLTGANLSNSNLSGAGLIGAWLTSANLSYTNLSAADLFDADLNQANLASSNLTGANLFDANLSDANLTNANLTDANLANANLVGANLTGANLTGVNLKGATLFSAVWPDGRTCGYGSNGTCI